VEARARGCPTIKTILCEPVGQSADVGRPLVDPWAALDRFLQELQGCDRSDKQSHLLLQSIRESTRADVVFLYSSSLDERMEIVGNRSLPPVWCRRLGAGIVAQLPADATQALRAGAEVAALTGSVPVQSVALVQVSRSKKAWAIALSLDPEHSFEESDLKIMTLARRMLSYHYQQLYASEELKNTLLGLVFCLTASIDAKDPHTCGHSERVARMAVRLGKEMQLPDSVISDVYLAGLLHDIGKIGIRDSVLQKAGKLTEEEMLHVQEHPVIGDRIISNVKQLAHLRPGVRNHHERFDGRGYPDAMAGEQIPLLARLLAVVDACDAMTSSRPYRPAMPTRQIDAIMTRGAGTQWDPKIIEHFMACRHELYPICQRGIGESVFVAVEHAVRARQQNISDLPNRINENSSPPSPT
jgi:HD-GYP domain-containing protein (c-di-GMP phosphodiesterase class II)